MHVSVRKPLLATLGLCLWLGGCVDRGVIGSQTWVASDAGAPEASMSDPAPPPATGDGGSMCDPVGAACAVPCERSSECPQTLPYCRERACVACLEDDQCPSGECEDGFCETEAEDDLEQFEHDEDGSDDSP